MKKRRRFFKPSSRLEFHSGHRHRHYVFTCVHVAFRNSEFLEFFFFWCDFADVSADALYVAVWKQIVVKLFSERV